MAILPENRRKEMKNKDISKAIAAEALIALLESEGETIRFLDDAELINYLSNKPKISAKRRGRIVRRAMKYILKAAEKLGSDSYCTRPETYRTFGEKK